MSRLWAEEGCTTGYIPCTAEHLQPWLDGGFFFVAQYDGEVIAYAAGIEKLGKGAIYKPEGEQYLNVDEVFVHADHRDKGVGTQLMEYLLDKAVSNGVVRSMVGSNNVDWMPTVKFYERHGYRMFAIQMYKYSRLPPSSVRVLLGEIALICVIARLCNSLGLQPLAESLPSIADEPQVLNALEE